MEGETIQVEVDETHVRMWIHYDNLRQKKNGTFLTANTILAAIAGFAASEDLNFVWAMSVVGIIIAIAWFLLLTRNAAYIAYHRNRVGPDWTPWSWTPRSSVLDRALPIAFGAFWLTFLVKQLSGCG